MYNTFLSQMLDRFLQSKIYKYWEQIRALALLAGHADSAAVVPILNAVPSLYDVHAPQT